MRDVENIWRERAKFACSSATENTVKSVKPCRIWPVARGASNKKGQPRTVDLLLLVEIINMKSRSEVVGIAKTALI
ncbi:hypothetical protein BMR06_16805 [Methylococcaceae bacterium HT5]|nr:hypothetical protein BMR06_16805 [Methylococcaceae bacterium HT5]